MSERKKPKFITPPNRLREKVGYGGIKADLLEKGQDFVEKNKLDFEPYARQFLSILDKHIADIKAGKMDRETSLAVLHVPIMELKASGGMFHYTLISRIAAIVLDFLESIEELNEDALNIIDVHQETLKVIVDNKLAGSGGKTGEALEKELFNACQRYYKKYKITPDA